MWTPVLENVQDGGRCERRQSVDKEGRPLWTCPTGRHRLKAHNPTCKCGCTRLATREEAVVFSPACVHRGEEVARHGCCGAPTVRLYACGVLGNSMACVLNAADAATLEWQGKPVTACETCDKRPL